MRRWGVVLRQTTVPPLVDVGSPLSGHLPFAHFEGHSLQQYSCCLHSVAPACVALRWRVHCIGVLHSVALAFSGVV